MRILLLSFYYPPDLCAGSFRAAALVEALTALGGGSVKVDVFTTTPNRYRSYELEAASFERSQFVNVERIEVQPHRGRVVDQARAYARYARAVGAATTGRKWDLVVGTSSRLMTAALAAHVAKRVSAPLYLDIRDLFSDTVADLFQGLPMRVVVPAVRWLERRTLGVAARVSVVSPGFLPYLMERVPQQQYRVFTNGVDEGFLRHNFNRPYSPRSQPRLIVYAGNIGEGQGLHRVLPRAARLLGDRAHFRLIGDGSRRSDLRAGLSSAGAQNVTLIPPVPREGLYQHYREADALLLHLNDHGAFQKVLPSKIFEYGATGKPILAGVSGIAADFLKDEVTGVSVFAPCDAVGMESSVRLLGSMPPVVDRSRFREKYARGRIMRSMAADILDAACGGARGSYHYP